ncbi:MAG: S9 family peptidase [Candidatus Omnitrophota bacterium]
MKSILRKLAAIALLVIISLPARALDSIEENEQKDISFEWIYKKKELGIKPFNPDLPRSLKWSEQGHLLGYLISSVTEAPHLAIYDPAKDATAFLITPFALYNALEELKNKSDGASIAPSAAFQRIPEDATAIAKIDGFDWLKDRSAVRLNVDGKRYEWELKKNLLRKEDAKKELPAGEKNDVEYSPNQRYAAYTRANDIYVYDAQQGKEIRLTQDGSDSILNGRMTWVYWEELHYRRSWRAFYWSPNNDCLAYLQFDEKGVTNYPVVDFGPAAPAVRNMFYPKAGTKNPDVRLGVVSLSTRETRWIDLGEPYEYISDVAWHPSGDWIAVQVLNRAQNQLRLLSADPLTATSRKILEENDDAWVDVQGGPFFLEKKDEFLWLSERSGFRHLYLYSNDGRKVKQLTHGDWEVNPSLWKVSFDIDEKENRIYFNANQASPLEKQYYSVSLSGGPIRRLTREEGTHNIDFSADRKYAVDRWNNISVPDRIQVINDGGRIVRMLGETTAEDYAPYRMKSKELLTLDGPDGLTFYASFLKPFDFDPQKKYPVILYVYGGPAGQVVGNSFTSAQDMAMVNRGFLLFSFDTRGTPGRGRAWVNAIRKNKCDIPLKDLSFAAEYLKSLPYVKPDGIGVWGWSNGGYMTCCAMLKTPGAFQAGAAVAPLLDWKLYDTVYAERYMGLPSENPDGYKESAPVNFAKGLKGQLLLAHGVSDDNVHIQNIYHLVDALIEAEKDYELYIYPQRDHGIGGDDRRYHLFSRIMEFFEKNLKVE